MQLKQMAIILLVAALLAPPVALAQRRSSRGNADARPASGGGLPRLGYTEFTLPNGLQVVLHEDHSTPVVAVNVWYHVGSKNEVPGRTGFAHLFEHMMFQGSKNFNDDYFKPLQEAGAAINGSTNADRTNYFEVLPSNFLELALFLEADRMGGLLDALTPEKLDNQRDVVKNERRQRYDNQPYGLAQSRIASTLYPPNHPYHWTTIGSLEDLSAASMEDVKGFFRRYYVPNNASLTIAGDFDPAEARRLVEKHFSPIKQGEPVGKVAARQPKLDREVRVETDDRVSLPRLYMVWHSTPAWTPDDAPLDLLANVMADGKGSRLYKSLVYEKQIAQDVTAFNLSRELAGIFQIVVTARPGKTLAELEAGVNEELAKIKAAPPTAVEMERAYNEREASFIYGLQTVNSKADQFNQYNIFLNKPAYFNEDLARYRRVSAADVRRAANRYLTDKRLVLTVSPRGPEKASEPVAAGPKAASASPTQSAATTQQPATATTDATTDERPAGVQPQTKAQAASTIPAGAAPPAATAPAAPSGQSNTTGADTSKLPKPGPDPQLRLPQVQRRKLSNGLDVLIVEHHELPVVSMNLVVKAGGAADPRERAGLASITASLLDEGTKTRSALDVSNELSGIGARLETGAGWDASTARLLTVSRHLDRALDIYSDVIVNPTFPADELQRLRAQRLTALRQQRDNARAIANVVYPALLYGREHPYGHPLTGDEPSITGMSREDVARFYETFYRPNNAALIVVGDVKPDALIQKLERTLAKWQRAHVPAIDVTAAPVRRDRPTVYLIDRPGAAQSNLTIGHVGVPRSTPDYFPLLLLNTLLGGQFISRVNLNLRESKGYTYGARTVFDYRRGSGPFSATADVQTAVTREAVTEFLKEIRGVRGEIPISPAELEYVRQSVVRGLPRIFETPQQIATRLEDVVLYDLPDDYFNNYIARLREVTAEDLNRVANRYLDPSRLVVLVVGDRKTIEPGLRALEDIGGSFTVLDIQGRQAQAGDQSGGSGLRQQ